MAQASSSCFEAKVLMKKGKLATATYINSISTHPLFSQHLNLILDNLLNPTKSIIEWDTIHWCKWLMARGKTPDEFANTGKINNHLFKNL